jgi:hypothetical protein
VNLRLTSLKNPVVEKEKKLEKIEKTKKQKKDCISIQKKIDSMFKI